LLFLKTLALKWSKLKNRRRLRWIHRN
jgi:hypothetical protein